MPPPVQTLSYKGNVPHHLCMCVCVCAYHQSPGGVLSSRVMSFVSTPRPQEFTYAHLQRVPLVLLKGLEVQLCNSLDAVLFSFALGTPVQKVLPFGCFILSGILFSIKNNDKKTFTFIACSACICKISSCLVWAPPQHFCG